MSLNEKIYIGQSADSADFEFGVTEIEQINFNNSVDLINNELSADTLEVDLFYDNEALKNVSYATPLFYYSNGRLVSKYYVSKIERTGVKKYKVYATSLIGLIENEDFYGGFYSGTQFEEVVNDILFSDGITMSKYNIYSVAAIKSSYGRASKIYGGDGDTKYWKYHLHTEFELANPFNTGSTSTSQWEHPAGNYSNYSQGKYDVMASAARADTSSPVYWTIRIEYANQYVTCGSSSDPLIGNGSKVIIDINPMAGKGYIKVNYVKYDDPTVTGELYTELAITPYNPTTSVHSKIHLGYAFGYCYRNSSGNIVPNLIHGIIYSNYQVYDENDILVVNAVYAENQSTGTGYIVNTCTGNAVQNDTYTGSGEVLYTVSDLSRLERDKELSESIIYGSGVASLPIRGWINICTRREALHQLLFAENVNMLKTEDGKILFATLPKTSTGTIPEESMFDNSAEENIVGAKKISVTEHSYETSGVTAQKIFDNSSAIAIEGQYLAKFDNAPIFGTPTASGITILYHNCNAAIVTGRGTITGTPYRHSQSVIQYAGNIPDGTDVSVSNIGIITSMNSDNVMNKLKNYYSGDLKKISNDIVYEGQRCGLIYDFKNLFRNSNTGFLTKLSSIASSFVRSICEFISGYTPTTAGGYSDFSIVTYGTEWTVPSAVKSSDSPNIRINLIGKGHDGTAGTAGAAGTQGDSGTGALPGGKGGAGGSAGTGGDGGDIYAVTVNVTNITKIAVSNSGYNTIVKTYNGSTLVSTYSSASGNKTATGFMNIFTGVLYARKGQNGIAGGAGGDGGYYTTSDGGKYIAPKSGGNAGNNSGGVSFPGETFSYQSVGGTSYNYCSYGGGGGAAYGANGGNAVRRVDWGDMISTNGGTGANASPTANVYTEYGSGGFGGNGGGGGGGGGTRYSDFAAYNPQTGQYYRTYETWPEANGGGGSGSAGTAGVAGCVIIYY